jgi:hypothetical protein
VKILSLNDEVDESFECRVCKTQAYSKDTSGKLTRTMDPIDPSKPLGWLNAFFDCNCSLILDLGYAMERRPGQIYAVA